jgi:putative DNA primase/helicase
MLTGAEGKIPARFLYQNEFEFAPAHHLWLGGNYKPHAKADDLALWERLKLIPCLVIHVEPTEENPEPAHRKDKDLRDALLAERTGILAWMISGAVEYYKHGWKEPKSVKAAGKEYQTAEDRLLNFITGCVEQNAQNEKTKRSDMYRAYKFAFEGERVLGKQKFNESLKDQYGFTPGHDELLGDVWLRVKLREGALPAEGEREKRRW